MELQALARDVFRLGCGIKMQTVLQSEEYHYLYQETIRLGLPYPDDSALVQILGIKLADRAYQNMPWAIRRRIDTWHDGPEAQVKLLKLIGARLRSERWRQSETRSYEYNSDYRCVLPAQIGSFTRGRVKPNCLGVAQMMVGFARAVRAPHYLANVIHANQDDILDRKIRAVAALNNLLGQYPDMAEHKAKIEPAYWRMLERSSAPRQAHHVLVIQTSDGTWWVVDPYLNALYALNHSPNRDQSLASLANLRHRTMVTRPVRPLNDFFEMVNMRLEALKCACIVIEAQYRQKQNWPGSVPRMLSLITIHVEERDRPAGNWADFTRELSQLEVEAYQNSSESDRLKVYAELGLIYATNDIEDLPRLIQKFEASPNDFIDRLGACLKRAEHDRDYEKSLAIRIVRLMIKSLMSFIDEFGNEPDARHHDCLEFAWAPMGLGAATLNHMQYNVGGKLATLFSGQWITYDALAVAKETGEPIEPEYLAIIQERLLRLQESRDIMILPLRVMTTV